MSDAQLLADVQLRPRDVSRGHVLRQITARLAFIILGVVAINADRTDYALIFVLSAAVLLFGIFWYREARRLKAPGFLRLEPDWLHWREPEGREAVLPYDKLWVAYRSGRSFVVKARREPSLRLDTGWFPQPGQAEQLLASLLERVRDLPDGPAMEAGIARRGAVGERLSFGREALGALAVFALAWAIRLLAVWGAGALPARAAVSMPELPGVLRWAAPGLLHRDLLHLLFDVAAYLALSAGLRRLLGTGRFLTIFLGSQLAGSAILSALGKPPAFGAVLGFSGLIAAAAAVRLRWPGDLPSPPMWTTWVLLLGSFLYVPGLFAQPAELPAYLAGFLVGLILSVLTLQGPGLPNLHLRQRTLYRVLAGGLGAVFAAAAVALLTR
jgi:membrane associated rhomboid family serine protease